MTYIHEATQAMDSHAAALDSKANELTQDAQALIRAAEVSAEKLLEEARATATGVENEAKEKRHQANYWRALANRERTEAGLTPMRHCNGCGLSLREATPAEAEAIAEQRELPDTSAECPRCHPAPDEYEPLIGKDVRVRLRNGDFFLGVLGSLAEGKVTLLGDGGIPRSWPPRTEVALISPIGAIDSEASGSYPIPARTDSHPAAVPHAE